MLAYVITYVIARVITYVTMYVTSYVITMGVSYVTSYVITLFTPLLCLTESIHADLVSLHVFFELV